MVPCPPHWPQFSTSHSVWQRMRAQYTALLLLLLFLSKKYTEGRDPTSAHFSH